MGEVTTPILPARFWHARRSRRRLPDDAAASARPGFHAPSRRVRCRRAERLRVFRSCPLITPKDARSSLQMRAMARAMAVLYAWIARLLTSCSVTLKNSQPPTRRLAGQRPAFTAHRHPFMHSSRRPRAHPLAKASVSGYLVVVECHFQLTLLVAPGRQWVLAHSSFTSAPRPP